MTPTDKLSELMADARKQRDDDRHEYQHTLAEVIRLRAEPAPTSAQLLAEAMRVPEIAALVEAAQACVHTSPPHKSHVDLESALSAIKDATQ